MEQENIRIGKERFFQGIFTTNANRHSRKPSLHAQKHPTNLKSDPTTYYLPHTHHPGWLRWSAELLATRSSLLFKSYFKRQTLTISSYKQFVSYIIQLTPIISSHQFFVNRWTSIRTPPETFHLPPPLTTWLRRLRQNPLNTPTFAQFCRGSVFH